MLFLLFLLIQLNLSPNITIQYHILQNQLILVQNFLVQFWKFLFILDFHLIDLIHEAQFVHIKWGILRVLFQEDHFLVFVSLVMSHMAYNYLV